MMGKRAKSIKTLYDHGRITLDGVRQAVISGIISRDDYQEITGQRFEE